MPTTARRCLLTTLPFALVWAAAGSAWAEGNQELQFRASATVVHDSNLFRLPDNANLPALVGRNSTAERVAVSTLGVSYNKAYSLQSIELDMRLVRYDYQNFSYLGFSAFNYRGAWGYAVTPRFRGTLSSEREKTLNSFVDFRGFNVRNERTETTTRLDGTYELGASWRLVGGFSRTGLDNSLPINSEADSRRITADVGLRYLLPSGSTIGYTLRTIDGTYTSNRTLPSPGFFDDRYSQLEHELRVTWAINRDTSADFRAAHLSRSYPTYGQRDFSGVVGGINLNWSYSPKLGLAAGWTRELGPFETADFNYSQTDRFTLGPVWQVSPKATVRVQLAHAVRNFGGTPTGVVTLQRRDVTRDASLSLDWQPYTFLSLSASLQNARRTSSLAGFDYSANTFNLSAQFTY
jgi:exopolysaccharide biosynthesis operon protein EpsL